MSGAGQGGRGERGNGSGAGGPARGEPLLPRMVGEVTLDLATTPEGRAAGLSVEIWPNDGVWLRVRSGHELRIYAVRQQPAVLIRWQRTDPHHSGPRTSEGDLGPAHAMNAEDLRTFVARWLGWRSAQ